MNYCLFEMPTTLCIKVASVKDLTGFLLISCTLSSSMKIVVKTSAG
jgi:hypothetical protein